MSIDDDEELLKKSPEEFSEQTAAGAGDFKWAREPTGRHAEFVVADDVAFPEVEPDVLAAAEEMLRLHGAEIADWAIQATAERDPQRQREQTHAAAVRLMDSLGGSLIDPSPTQARRRRFGRAHRRD